MKLSIINIVKRYSSTGATSTTLKPKVCIVGAGPAGFYAAQHIANKLKSSEIDIYERLPVPFGLVRFGVAPDHADLKKCMNTFIKTAQLPNIRFVGNVNLGKDVLLKDLRQAYHVVVLAYGVDDSKNIDIKNSNLKNVIQAKNFVGWYNGLPWDRDFPIDLTGPQVTVFGHGNVAIDVARILLKPVDELKTTDITEHALATLATSRVKEVHIVGRRGPLQVSFTTKELRELLNLKGVCNVWREEDMNGIADIVPQLGRPRKRLTELLVEKFQNRRPVAAGEKILKPMFCRTPKEFIGSLQVEAVKFIINKLMGDDVLEKKAVPTNQEEIIDTNLVVNSIGYKSIQADQDIPFNFERGIVKNIQGKVDRGLYVAGWLQSGPTGVLLNTMQNAFAVAGNILKDIETENLVNELKPGYENIKEILDKKNVQMVLWDNWLNIDKYEQQQGEKVNKPREKITDIKKMLDVAGS